MTRDLHSKEGQFLGSIVLEKFLVRQRTSLLAWSVSQDVLHPESTYSVKGNFTNHLLLHVDFCDKRWGLWLFISTYFAVNLTLLTLEKIRSFLFSIILFS